MTGSGALHARVFRIAVAAAVVVVGAWSSNATGQPAESTDPIALALPVHYGFDQLCRDLRNGGVRVEPAKLLAAHAEYGRRMDALRKECLPFVAMVPKLQADAAWNLKLPPSDREKLHKHQERMELLTVQAESALLAALAGVEPADPLPPALEQVRRRREVSRLIEQAQHRAGSAGGFRDMPTDVGELAQYKLRGQDCDEAVRTAIVNALDKHRQARLAAWSAWRVAADAASMGTLAAQFDASPPPESAASASRSPVATVAVDGAATASVIAAECALAQDIVVALPPRYRGALQAEVMQSMRDLENLSMPGIGPLVSRSPREVARLVLRLPSVDDSARAKVREICAKWVADDDVLVARQIEQLMSSLRGESDESGAGSINFRERTTRSKAALADLAKCTGAPWLSAPLPGVQSEEELTPLARQDEEAFGADIPTYVVRPGSWYELYSQRRGLVPAKWRADEQHEALALMNLSDAQATVARQVIADAVSEWQREVEPIAAKIRTASQRSGSSTDPATRVALLKELVALQQDRRAMWRKARDIEQRMNEGLAHALGEVNAQGREAIEAVGLASELGGPVDGCVALNMSGSRGQTDVLRAALELRGTAEDRAAIRHAVAAAAAAVRPAAIELLGACLDLQDAYDQSAADLMEARVPREPGEPQANADARTKEAAPSYRTVQEDARKLRDRVAAVNTQIEQQILSLLSDELAQRLRTALKIQRIAGATMRAGEDVRLAIESQLARAPQPKQSTGLAAARFNAQLDPFDVWASEVVDEVVRRLDANQELAKAGGFAIRPHGYIVHRLLYPARNDAIARAAYALAHELPAATVGQVPALQKLQ